MSDTYPRLSSYPTFIKVIVILAPPLRVAYPFILDVAGYPLQVIDVFIVLVRVPCLSLSPTTLISLPQGLFYLRWKKPHLARPFKGTFIRLYLGIPS